MAQLKASRTLVKSTPELWAECSDAASLARHLGTFGEIRITKLEPETAVAWEGEDVRGTVTLEPSGWGTRVILTAVAAGVGVGDPPAEEVAPVQEIAPVQETASAEEPALAEDLAPAEDVVPEDPEAAELLPLEAQTTDEPTAIAPEPVTAIEPEPAPEPRKPGFFARLFGRRSRPEPAAETPVAAVPEAPAEPEANEPGPGTLEPAASEVSADPSPEAGAAPAEPVPAAPAPDPSTDPAHALVVALDSLGKAHRRPFTHG